jgi:thiol:disulfide interchange protein DsbD
MLAVVAFSAFTVTRIATPARAGNAPEIPVAAGGDLVRAELVADVASVAPGATFRLAVRLLMQDGWHVNWLNPGDAGLAPGIAWKLPPGFRAGLVEWPLPERFRDGPLVIFGYAGEVVLSTEVRAPADLAPGGEVQLAADVSWLACREACIPGEAVATLRLPVEASPRRHAESAAEISAARARCPAPSLSWNVQARIENDDRMVLELQTADETTPRIENVFFFPFDQGIIENGSAQAMTASTGPHGRVAYQLRVELSRVGGTRPSRLSGVLVSASGWNSGDGPGAIEIDIPVSR